MPNLEPFSFEMDKATFQVFPAYCKGCGLCKEKCPTQVIIWSEQLGVYGTPIVKPKDEGQCSACGICQMVCPDCAISIVKKLKTTA